MYLTGTIIILTLSQTGGRQDLIIVLKDNNNLHSNHNGRNKDSRASLKTAIRAVAIPGNSVAGILITMEESAEAPTDADKNISL